MNNKTSIEKLLKIIGKIPVIASSASCCCINCVPVLSSAIDCASQGGTFYEGSDCSEFSGNCCKRIEGNRVLSLHGPSQSIRFAISGANTQLASTNQMENLPNCDTQSTVTRLPCCSKRVGDRCVSFTINFPGSFRGHGGVHVCRTVRIQGGSDTPNNYIVVCVRRPDLDPPPPTTPVPPPG